MNPTMNPKTKAAFNGCLDDQLLTIFMYFVAVSIL